MTKVEAIEQVLISNGGSASLQYIYDNITTYYPAAKASQQWEAGIRGVLYRELNNGTKFKKLGLSIYALSDYSEEKSEVLKTKVRMHSLMEGLCLELGNTRRFNTYTADPSMLYRDNTYLHNIATMRELPSFTYPEILHYARLIDVLWFNKSCLSFPQYAFEIVDSIRTLNGALNRCLQLQNFRTRFYIVAPQCHEAKFMQTMELEVYKSARDYFSFLDYDTMFETYDHLVKGQQTLNWLS